MALGITTSKHVINNTKPEKNTFRRPFWTWLVKNWQVLPLMLGFEPWGKYKKQEGESYLAKPRRDLAKFVCRIKVLPQMPELVLAHSFSNTSGKAWQTGQCFQWGIAYNNMQAPSVQTIGPLVWKRWSLCPFTALIHAEIMKGVLKGSFLPPESILLSQVVESTPQDPLAIRCPHGTKFSSKLFENVELPTPLLGPLCASHSARLTAAWLWPCR